MLKVELMLLRATLSTAVVKDPAAKSLAMLKSLCATVKAVVLIELKAELTASLRVAITIELVLSFAHVDESAVSGVPVGVLVVQLANALELKLQTFVSADVWVDA